MFSPVDTMRSSVKSDRSRLCKSLPLWGYNIGTSNRCEYNFGRKTSCLVICSVVVGTRLGRCSRWTSRSKAGVRAAPPRYPFYFHSTPPLLPPQRLPCSLHSNKLSNTCLSSTLCFHCCPLSAEPGYAQVPGR